MSKETHSMSKNDSTPKWLKTIQLNSWEAELLISALVLYALFQIPDYMREFSLQTFSRGSSVISFVNILSKAVDLLKFGYVLHIIIRGIWVASVGLSYVFPEGIKNENLNFKKKFQQELQGSNSLVQSVLRLEQLSSIIYGVSFIAFGSLIGVSTLMFSLVFIVELSDPETIKEGSFFYTLSSLYIIIFFLSSLLVFIDFATSGFLRRRNWSAKWFYPLAVVFRILTLSFLYRKSILALQSNTQGWKKYAIPFLISLFVIGFIFISKEQTASTRENYFEMTQGLSLQASNYENKRSEKDILICTIQSDIVADNVLQVFIKDLQVFEKVYEADTSRIKKWFNLNSAETSAFLNESLRLEIDSVHLTGHSWWLTQHPTSNAYGFVTNIDIGAFDRGDHIFKLELDTTEMQPSAKAWVKESDYNYPYLAFIPFYSSN